MSASAKKRRKASGGGAGKRPGGRAARGKAGVGVTGAAGEKRAPWFGFGLVNGAVLALGLVAVVIGYVLLDRGSVTAAPLLLVLGYVVLLPLGLLLGYRKLDE